MTVQATLQRLSKVISRAPLALAPQRLDRFVQARHYGIGKIPQSMVDAPVERIRNVGIMAHIDAGKTTTTERMLFSAGVTRHSGDVDKGDTVMDYMEQERARGITITSAAISFPWKDHRVNFIDTPGHVDFTMEVERALRVLDGAVAVYDAVKGIQAQSVTVWRQAQRYDVPCVAFINKMDRPKASMTRTLKHMETKLNVTPLVLQLPLGVGPEFVGVVDLLDLHVTKWPGKVECTDFERYDLTQSSHEKDLLEQALVARQEMFEQLAELDEAFMEHYLSVGGEASKVEVDKAMAGVRRVAVSRSGLPVMYGTALKNRGIEPVLDSIVKYLPSPTDLQKNEVPDYAKDFCAFVFKIVHDPNRGPLVFMRVYSGEVKVGDEFYNINRHCVERAQRVILISADEYSEVSSIGAGNIAVVTGLKKAITGDTLLSKAAAGDLVSTISTAKRKGKGKEALDLAPVEKTEGSSITSLPGMRVPEPVFFCTVEVESAAHQQALDHALACLAREDPSLRVTSGEDDETILSGMGELHIEIIQDRLRKEYKCNAKLGPLQVAYRETLAAPIRHCVTKKLSHNGRNFDVKLELELSRTPGDEFRELAEKSLVELTFGKTSELHALLTGEAGAMRIAALREGMEQGARTVGPLLSFPVRCIDAKITDLDCKTWMSNELLTLAASMCFSEAMASAEIRLLEPVMHLQIVLPPNHFTTVLGDMTGPRRGVVDGIIEDDIDGNVLTAYAPLDTLRGYASHIRRQTSGLASYSMTFSHYVAVTPDVQKQVVNSMLFHGGDVL
ncbi:ribosome-releasing factor 2, mitochondrial-like [Sycon ciliatum]|uniref:ribosome-releasing factor 2, mitochondrial-like n=1 Tax=Sycon ciliatum TaxID=27933 RepID=UPI0031F600D4